LINRRIWAFRFASPAFDTIVCYNDSQIGFFKLINYLYHKFTSIPIVNQTTLVAETKINSYAKLGKFLRQFQNTDFEQNNTDFNDIFFDDFVQILNDSKYHNGWFTLEQVTHACKSWADALQEENIRRWISAYDLSREPLKKVGLILAGNIPMVGFHDVLSVLMSGNIALIKLSSNDQNMIPFLLEYLKK